MIYYNIKNLDLKNKRLKKKVFCVKKRRGFNYLIAFLLNRNCFGNSSFPWQRTADRCGICSLALSDLDLSYLLIKNFYRIEDINTSFLKLKISRLNFFKRILLILLHLTYPSLIKINVNMRFIQKSSETIDLQL